GAGADEMEQGFPGRAVGHGERHVVGFGDALECDRAAQVERPTGDRRHAAPPAPRDSSGPALRRGGDIPVGTRDVPRAVIPSGFRARKMAGPPRAWARGRQGRGGTAMDDWFGQYLAA